MKKFKSLDTAVFGISTDSIYSHKIFMQTSPLARRINYPVLSDRTQEVSKKYGVLNKVEGFASRGTFIIDPEGIVQWIVINPQAVGRNTYEIIRMLEALQYNRETNLAVPADWKRGEAGISKDWDMVGKY